MIAERGEVHALMRMGLQEAGFDFDNPSPSVAWAAFQRFAARPLEDLVTVTVGYFCENDDGRDDVLRLGLMRRLVEPSGIGWSCGCLLGVAMPQDMVGTNERNWWWSEHGTIEEWGASVEKMRIFQKCLSVSGWRWGGFSE